MMDCLRIHSRDPHVIELSHLRRLGHVDQIRVKDVELVALHDLRRRVVVVVVRLVVSVPLVTLSKGGEEDDGGSAAHTQPG